MAINMVMPILIPLEENLHNATRLLPSGQSSLLEFSSARYCAALPEDSPLAASVITVTATHRHGAEMRYSITGGNRDGLFTIDQRSGTITLAAALDHELSDQHELEITAEGGGATARALVLVQVGDINDNAPEFVRPAPRITVIEEDDRDLPATITRVDVVDADSSDVGGLVFRVSGDGVDQHAQGDAFFTINARTGDLIQLRALDRDPPQGRGEWRLLVEVRDGQGRGEEQEATPVLPDLLSPSHHHRQASWGHQDPEKDPIPTKAWPRSLLKGDAALRGTGHRRSAEGSHGRREERHMSAWSEGHGILMSERQSFLEHLYEGRKQRIPGIAEIREDSKDNVEGGPVRPFSGMERISNKEATGYLSEPRKLKARKISMSTPEESNLKEDIGWSRRHKDEDFTFAPQLSSRRGSEGVGSVKHLNSSRSFSPSYPDRAATHGSSPSHQSQQATITAAASRQERRKQNWKTLSHNLDLHLNDESESTSQFIRDTKNECVTPQHDPHAQATRNDHLRTTSHDFQMRDVSASRKLHLVRFPAHSTHVETLQQGHPRQGGGREKRQPQEGQRKVLPTAKSVSLSGVSETSLRATDGSQQSLLPLSSDSDDPPAPSGVLISDYKAKVKNEGFHGSFLAASTERGSLTAGSSGQRSEATEKTPSNHRREGQDASSSGHKSSMSRVGDRNTSKERKMSHLLDEANFESPATTKRVPSSGRLVDPKVTREAGQEALSPTPSEESSCEEVRMLARNPVNTEGGGGTQGSRVHVVETVVTVVVKDINDNSPVFPNTTMLGHVQENGPAGEAVVVVSAWDADDASDGTNARLTYAIEKNVVDEGTGAAIFRMEPRTGLVRTARCCLDRETTPEYQIQVVASDGGGLKGTGTVVIRVADENDNSPRLARRLWELEVEETPPAAPPPNTTLLELTAVDRDANNSFLYRVVPGSGHGWENFGVRSVGASGQLFAVKGLDYELETHRRGFRFMVQVTDQGPRGWENLNHVDSAWVTVQLRDVNDNPPLFSRPHAHVTVREDTAPGTSLATLRARDPDAGSRQGVDYRLQGGWDALAVDGDGGVSLVRQLDREAPGGEEGVVLVVAVDRGSPPLSATATLAITVTDVNDCPPSLLPPTLLHVTEGGPPTKLGVLKVMDPDVWALGHGPPFSLSLSPTNPAFVFSLISLKFDPRLDSGRGGAELWTAGAVDREQQRQLSVAVTVSDAQGLAATHYLTVLVDDVNDNPMKPAAKIVYLWKTQGGGSDAPLGRVFVQDPDDWDLADKEFEWAGPPHPLFTLRPHDGTLFASSQVREGRYELQFSVSDRAWRQRGVAANVTVMVRLLSPDALAHAAPLTVTPTTPADLTRGWSPSEGGGRLGALLDEILTVLQERKVVVEVVSVYGGCALPNANPPFPATSPTFTPAPSTCVWVSAKDARGSYLDPVKIQGLLALQSRQIAAATNLSIAAQPLPEDSHTIPSGGTDIHLHSATSLASTSPPLQVVDMNATSLVTPRLTHASPCHAHALEARTPHTCLNGGRFIRSLDGGESCVCPGGTSGPRCKVLGRTFWGSGWAWLRPLPPCLPTTLSFRLLTRRPHGLLLYAGPLAPALRHATPAPMLTLQLVDGRPQALLEGAGGSVKLQVNSTLSDGRWHTLHLSLDHQGVVMMVDLCGRGWEGKTREDTHCLARGWWRILQGRGSWLSSAPLQVGGFAHSPPRPEQHGWREAPTRHHLTGCLAHLTINTQLIDLGEPAYSHASVSGCRPQGTACPGGCGVRGRCVGGLLLPWCECEPGWTGPECAIPTVPARLGAASYMKVALSFTPAPRVVKLQVRVRLRGARTGLLLHLAAHHRAAAITLHLKAGVACASVSGAGWAARRACVERRPLGDGIWHTVAAERHGHNLRVSVDDGDGWCLNETLASLETPDGAGPPPPLMVDKHDGVTVGGLPEFLGVNLVTVHDDLQDTCLDDLRVSDHQLPLPPAVNGTTWGQVTTMEHLIQGCHPPGDPCANTSCVAPLSCRAVWDQPSCSCGPGMRMVDRACEDVDECLWRPCLNGGSCLNLQPGYLCVCGPGHLGDHCQWSKLASNGHPVAAPAAIAAITVSVLVLVVLGVVLSLRLHRLRGAQGLQAGVVKGGIQSVKGTPVEGDEDGSVGETAVQEGSSDTLMELLKLRVSRDPSGLAEEGSAAPGGWESCGSVLLVETQHSSGPMHHEDLPSCPCGGDVSPGQLASPASGHRTRLALLPTECPPVGVFEASDLMHNPPVACFTSTPLAGLVDAGNTTRDMVTRNEGEELEEHCVLSTSASRAFIHSQPDRHTRPAATYTSWRRKTLRDRSVFRNAGAVAASLLDPDGLPGSGVWAPGGGRDGEVDCGNCGQSCTKFPAQRLAGEESACTSPAGDGESAEEEAVLVMVCTGKRKTRRQEEEPPSGTRGKHQKVVRGSR